MKVNLFNMEKRIIVNIVNKYLDFYKEEKDRLKIFLEYLEKYNEEEIIDWNNFNGHICASSFIYSLKEKKFLTLYHKDMKIFVYPGGHIDARDKTPLESAARETKEEIGIKDFKLLSISDNDLVPFDIDTHKISYNEHLNLPEHYHFDFRYLFVIPEISNIEVDKSEMGEYKWITINELKENPFFGSLASKLEKLLEEK